MKKLIISASIALILTLAGLFINYLNYINTTHLLLAIKEWGGEITIEYGFGLMMVHIFTMEMNGHDTISLRFDPISFIICFLFLFVLVYIVILIINKVRNK